MIKLDVWLTFCDGRKFLCGEIVCGVPDSHGRIEGAFRYSPEYLDHPESFPLDPVSLSLKSGVFECPRPSGVFAVFEDSLPDDWGRRLLVRRADLPRGRQTVPDLLNALGGNGMGALSYFQETPGDTEKQYTAIYQLETLLDAAARFEMGETEEDPGLRMLFNAGSSPGGARPKALIADNDNSLLIAKFPSIKDTFSIVPAEAATMSLAQKAGLNIPAFRMISCGSKNVLLVQRFDISEKGGRKHMISMQTLLETEGWYNAGYQDLIKILKKHSSIPEQDIPALFRQMVFNAFIGNTDDHLKNFTMLHDDEKGFFLSPAYDLLPDINNNREHVLYFEHSHYFPGIDSLLAIGKRAGVMRTQKIIDDVIDSITGWKNEFKRFGVPAIEIDRIAPGIERRIG
ncbi:MAG: type II toxin-antitoxin system HipA family toxin [Deltaproteobacteria bacterium]|nr:type II toxin-antitoxin system HipA family toxin [Deltaproteobacteria bacterium]